MKITIIRKTKKSLENKHLKDIRMFLKKKKKKTKRAWERYQNLTKVGKEKKRNKNLSEEEKKKLAEDNRNYYLTHIK